MLIIIFVLTYTCFLICLSVYYNVMLAAIKEGESYVAEIGNTLSSSTIVVDETFITRY